MKKRLVLDSSAVVEGLVLARKEDFEYHTTYSVVEELEEKLGKEKVEQFLELGLKVEKPSEETLLNVTRSAEALGEELRLSKTDLEVVALALELNAVIITDDYSIQNLAEELKIKYLGFAQKGIRRKIFWHYRCEGCGKYFKLCTKFCPICGSKVRTTIK
jgi:UPF0271 protein